MLPNGRAKRLIPPRDLRRRIFHRPLGRPQPSRAISIPVALARLRPVLVVISSQHVAGFAFQRLPTISRVASLTSSSFAEAVESRPSINAVSSSRVCCEAGSLVAMGCSFAGLPSPLLNDTLQRMHPAKFPATLRLHLYPAYVREEFQENEAKMINVSRATCEAYGGKVLVARFSQIEGYRCLSLMRALGVVKCQFGLVWLALRSCSQAAISSMRVCLSGMRRSRHWDDRAPSSDSARSSQMRCCGV